MRQCGKTSSHWFILSSNVFARVSGLRSLLAVINRKYSHLRRTGRDFTNIARIQSVRLFQGTYVTHRVYFNTKFVCKITK